MSVSINTYTGLKTAIADRMARTDMSSIMDDFIAAAEAEFNRELRLPGMITSNTGLSASSRFTALPTGFLEMQRLQANIGGRRVRLTFIGEELAPKFDDGSAGTPAFWNIIGTNIELLPAPASAITLDLSYWAELATITGGTANFLLTSHPDLYLYRCLVEASIRMGDDKRLARYTGIYNKVLTDVKRSGKRQRYARGMTVKAF